MADKQDRTVCRIVQEGHENGKLQSRWNTKGSSTA